MGKNTRNPLLEKYSKTSRIIEGKSSEYFKSIQEQKCVLLPSLVVLGFLALLGVSSSSTSFAGL